jgi:hypothetical protein
MLSSKTVCCNILCLLFFSLLSYTAHAQVFANDAGAREKHFIYEVKQIDEFFERFNNDTGSFIRKEYRTRHIKYTIDRPKLIKSLFNYETKTWDPAVINNFVKEVTLTQSPINLNFLADGWFAEANCKFQYNGVPVDIPIILRIIADDRNRSRWMIAAVKSNILKASPSDDGTHIEENGKKLKFINPASHSNNFIELDKAFNDKDNLADYFEPAFFNRNNALVFYNAVLRSRIKFLSVHDITYHFLQAGKWIFTVQYFQRESLNAGWLINSLKKVSAEDKKQYLKNLLEE